MINQNNICRQCNNPIYQNNTLYRGFDKDFCSNVCRQENDNIISKIDPEYTNPNKWRGKLKRTNSSFDIETNEGTCLTYKCSERNYNHISPIISLLPITNLWLNVYKISYVIFIITLFSLYYYCVI